MDTVSDGGFAPSASWTPRARQVCLSVAIKQVHASVSLLRAKWRLRDDLMQHFKRILVCVDRPDRDGLMLGYVDFLARTSGTQEVHLLHVQGDGVGAASNEPEVTPESLRRLATERPDAVRVPGRCCEVVTGAPLLEILRYAHDKDMDLIVVGRRCGPRAEEEEERGTLAPRVARKSTCSVLVLPDEHRAHIGTILVPVRDSECSGNALDEACGIAAATDASVVALNVFQVHGGYSRAGLTLEEHKTALEQAARRECDRIIERVDTRSVAVRCVTMADDADRPVPMIVKVVSQCGADLVVIGARGRTGAAGVLLGNVTERLMRKSPVPVLAVKKKGECLGVLQALLTLAGEG